MLGPLLLRDSDRKKFPDLYWTCLITWAKSAPGKSRRKLSKVCRLWVGPLTSCLVLLSMAIMVNFSLHTDSKFIAFIHALMMNSSLRRPGWIGKNTVGCLVWLWVPEGRLEICTLKVSVNVYCLAPMMFVVKITQAWGAKKSTCLWCYRWTENSWNLCLNYASASAQLHNMTLVQLYSRLFTSVVNTPVGSFFSNLIKKLARRRVFKYWFCYEE